MNYTQARGALKATTELLMAINWLIAIWLGYCLASNLISLAKHETEYRLETERMEAVLDFAERSNLTMEDFTR